MKVDLMNYKKPRIIAEAGCNHKGSMEIAKELIRVAYLECKADVIKFQKRNNKELLTEEQYSAPHPNPDNSYGSTYGEHREFLEFSLGRNWAPSNKKRWKPSRKNLALPLSPGPKMHRSLKKLEMELLMH